VLLFGSEKGKEEEGKSNLPNFVGSEMVGEERFWPHDFPSPPLQISKPN